MKIDKFYSHPGILLKDHLNAVGLHAKSFIEKLETKYRGISDIVCLIGKCHDFGKYTSFFQRYLRGERIGTQAHHSLLSALFGAYVVKSYLNKNLKNVELPEKEFLPFIAYLVISRHHGDLRSPEEILPRIKELDDYPDLKRLREPLRSEIKNLKFQWEDIIHNLSKIQEELKSIDLEVNLSFLDISEFLRLFKELDRLRYRLLENDTVDISGKLRIYFLTLLFYSALIDADKRSAGRDDILKVSRKDIPPDLVDVYIERVLKRDKFDSRLMDKMREEIYRKVSGKAESVPLDQKIFTLTAPTGSGKTLTAFSFALKLRDRIIKTKGLKPRIVYSLPFVNIIEQNYGVIYDVLKLISDFEENSSLYLIKHHHLADLEYKESNELKPVEDALLLIESWEAEVIVTTFVQLLHSIIAFKNSFLKKFHNIAGSIIILDEVQSIPIEYWDLVGEVLKGLVDFLDCRIILMTATRPLLLRDCSFELLEEHKNYFSNLNRVVIAGKMNKITDKEFIDFVSEKASGKSCLVVLNTISKSIDIYNALKARLGCRGFTEIEERDKGFVLLDLNEVSIFEELLAKLLQEKKVIFYLSTNITPIQRANRIKILKEFMKRGGKPILVSTQVVEAGVDLDFEVVFRDIGPLDSIIQVAGRCNRNYRSDCLGEVYVLNLVDNYVESVYGKVHPSITSKLLHGKVEEKDFYDLIDKYFHEVEIRTDKDVSKKILKAIHSLNFYHSQLSDNISKFQLIKEKGQFYDVFIEIDEHCMELRERFINEVLKEKDFRKRKIAYLQLKKEFYKFLISVRENRLDKNFPIRYEDYNLFFVSHNQLKDFYDLETGYKISSPSAFIW